MRHFILLGLFATTACSVNPGGGDELLPTSMTAADKLGRVTAIRDVAAGAGFTNWALLAGIAESETRLSHCWSEATWACKGPNSPSCGGGPVIAGSGDGACSLEQGGLGMFQFDGGTYTQTLARDGEDVLLLEGNTEHAVQFVAGIVNDEVPGIDTPAQAIEWMNSVNIVAGDPKLEQWATTVVRRYNGCQSDSATCKERRLGYRDNAIAMQQTYAAMLPDQGDDTTDPDEPGPQECDTIPSSGRIIDETDGCFVAQGVAGWHTDGAGYGNSSRWTMTTTSATGAAIGTWQLDVERSGRYRVEVHMDGVHGMSTQARYVVRTAAGSESVVFNQLDATAGFNLLGEFDLEAGQLHSIQLADNTGEGTAGTELLFDAIRVVPVADDLGGDEDEDLGGNSDTPSDDLGSNDDEVHTQLSSCSASGRGAGGLAAGATLLLAVFVSRRRRA